MLATLKGGAEFTQKGPTPPATVTFRTRCACVPNITICHDYLPKQEMVLYNADGLCCRVGSEF